MPIDREWQKKLKSLSGCSGKDAWQLLRELANVRLSFVDTLQLDRALQKRFGQSAPEGLTTKPVRLAVLGSSTVEQLLPGIRVGALRRDIWLTTYTASYGQYLQELLDSESSLHRFAPNAVLFALDAQHLFGAQVLDSEASASALLDEVCGKLQMLWDTARNHFSCQIIQQTIVPMTPSLLGQNEHRLSHSPRRLTVRLNERLRALDAAAGFDLLALDDQTAINGVAAWHDPLLWHKAKQEISPLAGAYYGDLVGRLLAARQGRSGKCLVLDLDNTLWGGVIGDDGLEGIRLGQGSPQGEAFLAVQRYALGLARRGIILAVCSKNDEANALLPFEQHPEMILKRTDISCFVANWNDKASNLREIARQLNIGLDALVFVDDNPFERNIVRRELPMVAVPELPDDPAFFPEFISAAGYFEALHLTQEDLERTQLYQANSKREQMRASATDMDSYLRSLEMELFWSPFDRIGLQRIVQLINKTNQFNLTTKRYTESDVLKFMENPRAFTLQLRLTDRFGDNGIIGIVIALLDRKGNALIDTWLMSCRVLGRGVEEATLGLIIDESRRLGAEQLIGEYRPTEKNDMVKDHFLKLGFTQIEPFADTGTRWTLSLKQITTRPSILSVKRF